MIFEISFIKYLVSLTRLLHTFIRKGIHHRNLNYVNTQHQVQQQCSSFIVVGYSISLNFDYAGYIQQKQSSLVNALVDTTFRISVPLLFTLVFQIADTCNLFIWEEDTVCLSSGEGSWSMTLVVGISNHCYSVCISQASIPLVLLCIAILSLILPLNINVVFVDYF